MDNVDNLVHNCFFFANVRVAGGDKNGGNIHNGMWIMWKSRESNKFFVQCVRLTIIFNGFAAVCRGNWEDLGINGLIITRMLIFYEFVELKTG